MKIAFALIVFAMAIIPAIVVGSIALHKELDSPTPYTNINQFLVVDSFTTTFYANSTTSNHSFSKDVNITYQILGEVITLKIPAFTISTTFDANDTVDTIQSKALPNLVANTGLEATSTQVVDLVDNGEALTCTMGLLQITKYITLEKLNNVTFSTNATSVGLSCSSTGYKTIQYMRLYLADDVFK